MLSSASPRMCRLAAGTPSEPARLAAAGATLRDMVLARVYVKRQEDYEKARAICKARLGELPVTYAMADVCRPDLLVEIEGIAFTPRG